MTIKNREVEKGKRGAAAMANATQGRSRNLSPNKNVYDRRSGVDDDVDWNFFDDCDRLGLCCVPKNGVF